MIFKIIGIIGAGGWARLTDAIQALSGVNKVHIHPIDNTLIVEGTALPHQIIGAALKTGVDIELM